MSFFRWGDIDHSLVGLRLIDLAEEMHRRIEADERRIQFENRGNMNSKAVPSLVLNMKQERVDEQAGRVYEIYCDVWEKQGYVKSAAFLRAVYARAVVSVFRARRNAIASEFSRFATRTNFPAAIRNAHLQALQLNMQRLEDRWRRRVEIEAKECEHAEQKLRLAQQTIQSADVATAKTTLGAIAQANDQSPAGESRQPGDGSTSAPKRRRPGRGARLPEAFVVDAGKLWQEAISGNSTKVSNTQLGQIASALDAAGHSPPSSYLEGKYARDLKNFNSRNSNSKIGPLKTWSQLVDHADKDHIQGMRRLLSRCAEKVDKGYPTSGINSGQKTSS